MGFAANALSESQRPSLVDGGAARQRGGGVWRVLIVAAVLVGGALALHLTPVRSYLADARHLREQLAGIGVWVYPLAIVAVAALLACGVPRLPIHAAGGMVFGFGIGLALTMVGAVLGHYCVFLFIRWGGRDWVLGRWPKLRKWGDLIRDHGVVGVLLVRQLPAHAMLINMCLALSHVKHRHFLIGTALGLLPEAIPAALIGAGLMKASLKDSAGYLTIAAAAFAVIWIVGGYAFGSWQKQRPADSCPADS
jgi:uncharacterized membrane protein YdjX (TVP38/TMEM64 family)